MLDGPLSRRFPLLAFARRNLSRARARTILAMAGITIGVLAIASLGMFGAALQTSITNTVSDFTQTVRVSPGEDAGFDTLGREEIAEIRQYSDYPVYPVRQTGGRISAKNQQTVGTVIAMDRPGPFVTVASGEVPPTWRSGALVGAELAETLELSVGDSVVVDGERYRVRAILAEPGQASMLQTGNAVILPSEQLQFQEFTVALVRADSPEAAFATSERLQNALNPSDRSERYAVQDAEQAIQQFRQQLSLINTFLVGVGAVSLLVASVSILNVMLMSTIERREEIGVLRATGYHRTDVLKLMLAEATLLGVVGAVVGVVLSVFLGMLINAELLSDPLAFTAAALQYTVIGFVFGTGASFFSGLYPAWKAANARPVEALRS